MVIRFDSVAFSGSVTPSTPLPANFQITSSNDESTSVQVVGSCSEVTQWNAYLCDTTIPLGVMIFKSNDDDQLDRSVQPVYITNKDGFNNRLNSYMDHCWDGFYTCQKRESIFPTMIAQNVNEYTLEYTGTAPKKQEFHYNGVAGSQGFVVTIKYQQANPFYVTDLNNNPIPETPYSVVLQAPEPPSQTCGSWRFEGAATNRLQFWMEPGCRILVKQQEGVQLAIRLSFTLAEFFSNYSVTDFADQMAVTLGVAPGNLKIVSVYEGSTVFVTALVENEELEDPADDVDLTVAETVFVETFTSTDGASEPVIFLNQEVIGVALDDTVIDGELPSPPTHISPNCIPQDFEFKNEDDECEEVRGRGRGRERGRGKGKGKNKCKKGGEYSLYRYFFTQSSWDTIIDGIESGDVDRETYRCTDETIEYDKVTYECYKKQ